MFLEHFKCSSCFISEGWTSDCTVLHSLNVDNVTGLLRWALPIKYLFLWSNISLFIAFMKIFSEFIEILNLGQVVRELKHSRDGVTVMTEDGCFYQANYVILSASIGVLQSDLISFTPPLPVFHFTPFSSLSSYQFLLISFCFHFCWCKNASVFWISLLFY